MRLRFALIGLRWPEWELKAPSWASIVESSLRNCRRRAE